MLQVSNKFNCPVPHNHTYLEEWKRGNHMMGSKVPKYQPECPSLEEVNLKKYPLQVAKIETLPGKSGWAKYKLSLPQSFRMLHYSDVLYGPDWRELISDFDKRPLISYKWLFFSSAPSVC